MKRYGLHSFVTKFPCALYISQASPFGFGFFGGGGRSAYFQSTAVETRDMLLKRQNQKTVFPAFV